MKLVSVAAISALFVPSSSTLPDAAAWAIMILGFGIAGGMLRRRDDGIERIGRA